MADEEFFTTLAERFGTPVPDAEERRLVLDLTRVVAHSAERRFAPLTAWALALTLDEADPAARIARLREVLAALEADGDQADGDQTDGDQPGGGTAPADG